MASIHHFAYASPITPCPACDDSGTVEVPTPPELRDIGEWAQVWCDCPAGEKAANEYEQRMIDEVG